MKVFAGPVCHRFLNARADETTLQDFMTGSMATIEQCYASQPFAFALWSVTGPRLFWLKPEALPAPQ